ncbi:TPA: hypothetical protein ACU9ZY_005920 [Pseudomonas aeruginosa]|uniref:hypothetical protein n=1 Tax=Pseudomonas aeruginosa TaxID=287 RepID=UPI00235A2815|nr:hypothetical protein KK230_12865 [Pseudomonas aeruginosa]HBO2178432.1 hypothetical protein [Pseudomonas aeruginosa]HBO5327862.1 hypothetical protein [Pseudomonas aeruginosa]HCR1771034.1 hypothetical protein [Pseudomonas aeruginosa]
MNGDFLDNIKAKTLDAIEREPWLKEPDFGEKGTELNGTYLSAKRLIQKRKAALGLR